MTDRERTDKPREENLTQQFIQGERGVESRNADIDRSDREDVQRRIYEKADSGFFSTVGKIAALGVGAYALGKAIPKNVMIDALDKMGARGKDVAKRFLSASDELMYGQTASRRLGTRSEFGTFLTESIEPTIQDLTSHGVGGNAREVAIDEMRKVIRSRYATKNGVSSQYNNLTVSEVLNLNPEKAKDIIGENVYDILMARRGVLDPTGNLFSRVRVDSKLYSGPNGIKDTRWSGISSIGNLIKAGLSRKMPVLNFSPYDVIKPLEQLLGKGNDTGIVGRNQTMAPGIKSGGDGLNLLIGGKLWNFGNGTARQLSESKFTRHEVGSIGDAYMASMGSHPLQRPGVRVGVSGVINGPLDIIGLGQRYRTAGAVVGMPKLAAERRAALAAGDITFHGHERIKAGALPWADRLSLQKKMGSHYTEDAIIDNPYFGKSYDDLPFLEKLKLLASEGDLGTLRGKNGDQLHTEGLFGSRTTSTKSGYGKRKARASEKVSSKVGPGGVLVHGMEATQDDLVSMSTFAMEDSIGSRLGTAVNFATTRLNNLIGATTGLGFRPSSGRFGAVKNAIKIGMLGMVFNPFGGMAFDAIKYVNYVFEKATAILGNVATLGMADFQGISPLGVATSAYKYATLGMAGIKDAIGITSASKYAEGLMPGIMTSSLSGISRTVGLGMAMSKRGGSAGLLASLGISMFTGGLSDIMGPGDIIGAGSTTSMSELSKEYSGEKKVAVKSSRWWGMGRTGFQGEGIDRYEQHWLAKNQSNWEYSDTLYGSKGEYFAHQSSLPTPHNAFGLIGTLIDDKNYFAEKHAADRPYPIMPDGSQSPMASQGVLPPSLPKGVSEAQLSAIGYETPTPQTVEPVSEESFGIKAKKSINNITEFLGIYKFLGEAAFGKSETGPVLASAANITDRSRLYWDADLGGLFGHCFVSGTIVDTNRGRIPIEEIEPSDKVLSADGTYKKVISKLTKKSNDIVSIKVSNIDETLTGTSTHHIPVFKPLRYGSQNHIAPIELQNIVLNDINLGDINVGDYVVLPLLKHIDEELIIDLSKFSSRIYTDKYVYTRCKKETANIIETIEGNAGITRKELRIAGYKDNLIKEALGIVRHKKTDRFNRYLRITKDIAYLMGWWVAEGSCEKDGRVSFAMHANEIEYAEKIALTIKNTFGSNSTIKINGNSLVLRSQCIPLNILLTSLFGTGAHNKTVHHSIKTMNKDLVMEFLKGVITGDGWCDEVNTNAGFTSVSSNLCKDIFDMALSLGIIGDMSLDYIEKGKGNYPQGTPRKDSVRSYIRWQRRQSSIQIKSLLNNMTIPDYYIDNLKSFIYDGKLFIPVRSIEIIESEEVNVYDLEVENLHYYTANHILVHNTELLRRYMPAPNDIGISDFINDIPNNMPTFMPGARSMFSEDRGYFKDFTLGDPYAKIKGGEYRLPGASYEAMNELHSGQPGTYDPVDALLILADVAPYSAAFKYYDRVVSKMNLEPQWKQKLEEAKIQRQNVLKGYSFEFVERRFTNTTDNPTPPVVSKELNNSSAIVQTASANAQIQYNAVERAIGAGYERLTLDALPEISKAVPFGGFITNKLFPHFTAEEDYYQRQVMGAKFNDWTDPLGTYVRPKVQMLYNENPITASVGGAALGGAFLGSTPMGGIFGAAAGAIGMGAASSYRAARYGRLEGGFKPAAREREERAYEYFDMLEFERYERAKQQAYSNGLPNIASEFERLQSTRTVVGMNVSDPMYAMGAVPKPERFYVDSFKKAQGEDRANIMDMVPSIMQDFYARTYDPGLTNHHPEERVNEYFQNNQMPADDWAGWNPGISKWQIMANTMNTADNSIAIDMHRQHVSTSMSRMSANQYPGIGLDPNYVNDSSDWVRTAQMKAAIISAGVNNGSTDMRVTTTTQPSFSRQATITHDLRQNRPSRNRRYQERALQ
jgi:intein/homing endonuclease